MSVGIFILLFTIQVAFPTNSVDAADKNNEDTPIVYPGPVKGSGVFNRYGTDKDTAPAECKGKTYCTIKPHDYPEKKFSAMFKTKGPAMKPTLVISDLDDRQGDPDEIDNCESSVSFDPLYQVRTDPKDKWRTVVQAPDKNYVQNIRLEICKDTKKACFTVFPKLPMYKTACKQKYSSWVVVVDSDEETGKMETITVNLPTCCSCHYKAPPSPLLNIGLPQTSTTTDPVPHASNYYRRTSPDRF